MRAFLSRIFSPKPKGVVASLCEHRTVLKGEVFAFGESTTIRMPHNSAGSTNYCLACIGKMTIRCAWCGGPIFIGDPITLYTPQSEESFSAIGQKGFGLVLDVEMGFKIPAHAAVYQRNPLQVIGCLRCTCAQSGADRAGFWMPGADGRGCVYRVMTAFEQILAGSDVVVADPGDPSQAIRPKDDEHPPAICMMR